MTCISEKEGAPGKAYEKRNNYFTQDKGYKDCAQNCRKFKNKVK